MALALEGLRVIDADARGDQHHLGPPGRGRPRSGQPGLGPFVGGLRRLARRAPRETARFTQDLSIRQRRPERAQRHRISTIQGKRQPHLRHRRTHVGGTSWRQRLGNPKGATDKPDRHCLPDGPMARWPDGPMGRRASWPRIAGLAHRRVPEHLFGRGRGRLLELRPDSRRIPSRASPAPAAAGIVSFGGRKFCRAPLRACVGEGGLEPPHPFGHRNLNPARLPIPPLARVTGQQ